MKIIAALSWYLEPVEFLDRLVRSLAGHVDEFVALDGAWHGFRPAAATSRREERDTIRAAAEETGLTTHIHVPKTVWKSQIKKRQRLFDLAICDYGADWVLVVDGDCVLSYCDDIALQQALSLTGRDVAMVMVTAMNQTWPWSELPTNPVPERHIWRGDPGLTVENAHNGVRIGSRWLNGDAAHVTVEEPLDLSAIIGFDHDNMNRSQERTAAMRDYRKHRQAEGIEAWL